MPKTAFIVDDESLARERIRSLLEQDPRIEVVGEASDGARAIEKVKELKPDLLFLDIQMPEKTGIDVAIELRDHLDPLPAIVFVTAYDNFALKAFDLHAIDYLLKPFDKERFNAAIEKVMASLSSQESESLDQRIASLISEFRPSPENYLERLSIKKEGRVLLLRVDEIDWIGSANNYVEIHVGKEQHLMRETLSQLESKLDRKNFLRVSRTSIVSIDRIREIQPLFHGEHVLILQNGDTVTASRSYKEALKPLLGK